MESEGIKVTLYGETKSTSSSKWIGIGFSKSGYMVDADIYMCKSSTNMTGIVSAFAPYQDMPILNSGVGIVPGSVGSFQNTDSFLCSFTLKKDITKENVRFTYGQSGQYYVLLARGPFEYDQFRRGTANSLTHTILYNNFITICVPNLGMFNHHLYYLL